MLHAGIEQSWDEKGKAVDLAKRFSIAHYDSWPHPSLYYEAIKRSSQAFRDEIYDIYFGKIFRYKYQEQEVYDSYPRDHEVVYGNVMGVEASNEQVDHLLRIQDEFGIAVSLTVNQANIPVEVFYSKNDQVLEAFVQWLQGFYDKGVRSCTLANSHMIRTGILQNAFPDMLWKNTVNQQVSSAQQVLDYLYLGYNVIQLDRSLNRNMDELKRVKDVVETYKSKHPNKIVKTCLLVREDCMPSCPFKREHDDLQIYHRKIDYRSSHLAVLSCSRWVKVIGSCVVPRSGTNCYWSSVETFKEYAGLVDIFKHSGRLTSDIPQDPGSLHFKWFTGMGDNAVECFSAIIDERLEPVHWWFHGPGSFSGWKTDRKAIKEELDGCAFLTAEARKLEQKVKNCKNQCYDCHLCERTFGLPDFDSLIEF